MVAPRSPDRESRRSVARYGLRVIPSPSDRTEIRTALISGHQRHAGGDRWPSCTGATAAGGARRPHPDAATAAVAAVGLSTRWGRPRVEGHRALFSGRPRRWDHRRRAVRRGAARAPRRDVDGSRRRRPHDPHEFAGPASSRRGRPVPGRAGPMAPSSCCRRSPGCGPDDPTTSTAPPRLASISVLAGSVRLTGRHRAGASSFGRASCGAVGGPGPSAVQHRPGHGGQRHRRCRARPATSCQSLASSDRCLACCGWRPGVRGDASRVTAERAGQSSLRSVPLRVQGRAVRPAVPQARRLRTSGEHVAQVGACNGRTGPRCGTMPWERSDTSSITLAHRRPQLGQPEPDSNF